MKVDRRAKQVLRLRAALGDDLRTSATSAVIGVASIGPMTGRAPELFGLGQQPVSGGVEVPLSADIK